MFQSTKKRQIVSSICLRAVITALTAHRFHFSDIEYPISTHPRRVLAFQPTNDREEIDDENISVTRTNSTSLSRCSIRSRSRSPPHSDEDGVLNLDTKSSKIALAEDSSAFEDVKQKSLSEHQSRLEEVYQSSVDHQSTKQKSRKFSSADDVEPLMAHEENGFQKSLDLLKNTKVRRNANKDDSGPEPFGIREKPPLFPRNYIPVNLDLMKLHNPASNVPLSIPEAARLYSPYFYPFPTPSSSDPTIPLFSNNFMNYQHYPLFIDAYRKEQPKLNLSPTVPSGTSPPKVGSQPYPGSRVEPVLPNQTSVAPIH